MSPRAVRVTARAETHNLYEEVLARFSHKFSRNRLRSDASSLDWR